MKPTEQTFRVEEPGQLLPFLREKLAGVPGGKVKSLLEHGAVAIDGRSTTKYNAPLRPGQVVSIRKHRPEPPVKAEHPAILYEDRELLVIDKPAGLLTIGTGGKEPEETAYRQMTAYVRRKNPENRIFVVHRLDRDTSGVVVFAKNPEMKAALQDNWDKLALYRGYYAVVEGRMEEPTGRLVGWLKETSTHIVYLSRREGDGKEAVTNYQVLRSNGDYLPPGVAGDRAEEPDPGADAGIGAPCHRGQEVRGPAGPLEASGAPCVEAGADPSVYGEAAGFCGGAAGAV